MSQETTVEVGARVVGFLPRAWVSGITVVLPEAPYLKTYLHSLHAESLTLANG